MSEIKTFSLQDVVDNGALGPAASASYLESLDVLDNVVRECIYVSHGYADIRSPTARHFYASVLFTVMITRGVSLLTLAPHTPWADKQIEHWDYGSMTGVARTMIELRVAYYYLCTDECSEDEWYFRWNLFNLHDCTSRIRMFDALGDAEQVSAFKEQANELRERLTSNPFLATLDPKRHKRLLHGQTAYLFPLEQIAEKAGIELSVFRWLYVLFSAHVHALPMSFFRIGGDFPDRGRGLPSESEEGYSALCLSLAAALLTATRDEMHDLFAGLTSAAVPEPDEVAGEPKEMAIGAEIELNPSREIALRVKRTGEEEFHTTYVHRPTGENVLERVELSEGGVELRYVDPFFWTFKLNGEPVTERALEEALTKPHAQRIDHNTREIHLKTGGID